MDPAPINKTEIISFIVDEILLKLWNISSSMRKRVQMVLKDKDIRIQEYNERALKLNGWVKVNTIRSNSPDPSEIMKGVANYSLQSDEAVERSISLNKTLRCEDFSFESNNKSLEIDRVADLSLAPGNVEFYSKHSFNRINQLKLESLSNDQINLILSKTKQIDKLTISSSIISKLDLTQFNIKELELILTEFTEKVLLPTNLNCFIVTGIEGLRYINNIKTNICDFSVTGDECKYLKNIKGIKMFTALWNDEVSLELWPSTLRHLPILTDSDLEKLNLCKLKEKFSYLMKIDNCISFEDQQKLNLRCLSRFKTESKEKTAFRPKQIFVTEENSKDLGEHPELFENVREVRIFGADFNYDCLPAKINRLFINNINNFESKSLIRFEEERLEV